MPHGGKGATGGLNYVDTEDTVSQTILSHDPSTIQTFWPTFSLISDAPGCPPCGLSKMQSGSQDV